MYVINGFIIQFYFINFKEKNEPQNFHADVVTLCYGSQRLGIAEGGIFCVPSADTEADFYSIAEDNICCLIEFRHPDN